MTYGATTTGFGNAAGRREALRRLDDQCDAELTRMYEAVLTNIPSAWDLGSDGAKERVLSDMCIAAMNLPRNSTLLFLASISANAAKFAGRSENQGDVLRGLISDFLNKKDQEARARRGARAEGIPSLKP